MRQSIDKAEPSLEYIENLAMKALSDNEALSELGAINEALGRKLNARMRRLEKAGETAGAYETIKNTIGGKRASQAHTGSAESLMRSIEKTKAALNYKRGTLSGIRDAIRKELNSLGVDDISKKNLDTFHELGKIGALDEFKKAFGGSSFFIELRDAMNAGADITELLDGYKAMLDGVETDVFEIWDNWVEIEW